MKRKNKIVVWWAFRWAFAFAKVAEGIVGILTLTIYHPSWSLSVIRLGCKIKNR